MKTAFWIWTVFCIAGAGFLIWLLPTDQFYGGTNISLRTGDQKMLIISADSVIEAASSDFFLLRKVSGETVVGLPSERPLGWDAASYYKAGPTRIARGEWLVEDGSNITVHLTSDENLSVKEAMRPSARTNLVFLLVILGLAVWVLGIIIVH